MKRFVCNLCLTVCVTILIAASAQALETTGSPTSTFIFDMIVNKDGTVIDNGTIKVDSRFTKTELKNLLKQFTTDSLGFGNIAAYRIKSLPFYTNDQYADSVWLIYFDSAGYSVYVYRYKDSIEKE